MQFLSNTPNVPIVCIRYGFCGFLTSIHVYFVAYLPHVQYMYSLQVEFFRYVCRNVEDAPLFLYLITRLKILKQNVNFKILKDIFYSLLL